MKPKSQPSLQISFLPKLCGPGMREGGNLKMLWPNIFEVMILVVLVTNYNTA
jgi:hypothetical protein